MSLPSRSLQDFVEDNQFQEERMTEEHFPHGSVRILRQEYHPRYLTNSISQETSWFSDSQTKKISQKSNPIPDNVLLNMTDFKFLKDASHICTLSKNESQQSPFLITFVHSAHSNFIKRQIIRETWASQDILSKLNVKVFFLVGLSNSSVMEARIAKESDEHRDIVQGNFFDSYRNLTYKHLTGLRWVTKFCNESTFVMKADDDAFIDIFQVVKSLKRFLRAASSSGLQSSTIPSHHPLHDILACSLFPEGTSVKRTGKWALSKEEYPGDSYPTYCSGIAYFMTPDVSSKLFNTAHLKGIKVMWIDDVFVTGVLPAVLGLKHKSMGLKFTYHHHRLRSWVKSKDNKVNPYLVSDIGDVQDWQELMKQLWEKTRRVSR
jgi:beta-1,3-galactosyltransferase 1